MKRYKTDRAISSISLQQPSGDLSRLHAANHGIGAMLLIFVAYIFLWTVTALLLENIPEWSLLFSVPVSVLCGIGWGGWKLLDFTNEYHAEKRWFAEQAQKALDFQEPVGAPLETFTMLRGADGQYHRLDTELTVDDKNALKRYLLKVEAVTVRDLYPVVGQAKAGRLRNELIELGICSRPKSVNQGSPITELGKRTVQRW